MSRERTSRVIEDSSLDSKVYAICLYTIERLPHWTCISASSYQALTWYQLAVSTENGLVLTESPFRMIQLLAELLPGAARGKSLYSLCGKPCYAYR